MSFLKGLHPKSNYLATSAHDFRVSGLGFKMATGHPAGWEEGNSFESSGPANGAVPGFTLTLNGEGDLQACATSSFPLHVSAHGGGFA